MLGIIDQKGCKILDVLGREISVQLFADTVTPVTRESVANNRRADRRSTRPDLQAPLKLCAVLYGPAALGESVGMFTAECKLYLQHPRHCDRNVPYRNPQCLSKKDDHFINTYDLNHIFNDDSLRYVMFGFHYAEMEVSAPWEGFGFNHCVYRDPPISLQAV